MRVPAFVAMLGVLALAVEVRAQVPPPAAPGTVPALGPVTMPPPAQPFSGAQSPELLARMLFRNEEFSKLEALVAEYQKSGTRVGDGRQALYLLTSDLSVAVGRFSSYTDKDTSAKLASWREQFPKSALQPIAAAMHVHEGAWRARGDGPDATVTEEGQRLFRERNLRALKILLDNKPQSSSLPTWYEYAIRVSSDYGMSGAAGRELFDEGIRKFPGYSGIYFAYVRQLSPLWGGSWEAVDEFIVEQTSSKVNDLGEILYTQVYAYLDELNGAAADFFDSSRVSWPRMRRGFEELMIAYPASARNRAIFFAYACRASDSTSYLKLRPDIDRSAFREVAPEGISIEVCDARFMRKA